jgi:predicted transposase/invertase (TIGR01784 family)
MQPGAHGIRGGRLDPKLDIVFWMLFGAEQNRHLLVSLLNAVLQPPAPIEWAEVQHAEPERLGVDDKSIALDVRVRLANGEQIDVEMQSQRHPALRERALYYWARLYVGQQQHGSPYTDLRRCAVIWITNFIELAGQRFHSIFALREVRDAAPLTEHLEMHLLELPKLREALERNDEPTLVAWARFLTATADEDLETLAMEHPVLKQAKDALDRLSADPDARVRAEQREMALFSYELGLSRAHRDGMEKGLEQGIEQGVEKGLEQGRVQGKAELLQRLLTLKFGSLPADVAGRVAGATDEELASWADRVLLASTLESVFET